jgi:hypothetical protein
MIKCPTPKSIIGKCRRSGLSLFSPGFNTPADDYDFLVIEYRCNLRFGRFADIIFKDKNQ